jgi:hypothetical protein
MNLPLYSLGNYFRTQFISINNRVSKAKFLIMVFVLSDFFENMNLFSPLKIPPNLPLRKGGAYRFIPLPKGGGASDAVK